MLGRRSARWEQKIDGWGEGKQLRSEAHAGNKKGMTIEVEIGSREKRWGFFELFSSSETGRVNWFRRFNNGSMPVQRLPDSNG